MPDVVVGEYSFDTGKQVGKGRHATVYEGYHTSKGTKVAVKKVDWSSIHKNKHDNLKKKLQQSLGVQQKKPLENVLALLDFKEVDGESYIIYEFCDDTLDNYLGATPLSEEAALDLFKQTAAIVYHKFATSHKFLLNREITPENVLVVKSGDSVKLKFVDIALGHYAEDRSIKWPCYYAPEIISHEEFIDKRKAEVFSIGLILYRFLVGRLPYTTQIEFEEERAKGDSFALPDLITDVTDHTRNLVKRSLQVHPDNRLPLPAVLKKFGFDLPEPGSLRFSSSQGDLSPEMLLIKIEEATEEIVNLKERIRRLEAEKLEIELQCNLKIEQAEINSHDQTDKLNEELQLARQELSEALEQILKSDEQYDALDARKRKEIEELMHQLVLAHEALEEVARKTTEELVADKRNIEELKDSLESKQEEIQDLKKEHEMVEMFRKEELESLKRELDDLTELFVQIEQGKREEEDRAANKYDEMIRLKDLEIIDLKRQLALPNNGTSSPNLKPNGISYQKMGKEIATKPSWHNRPLSPVTSNTPNKPWTSGSNSRPVSPSPSPCPSPSPTPGAAKQWGNGRPLSPSHRPQSTSPELALPHSPRTIPPPHAKTWTAPQYIAANTSSNSLPRPPPKTWTPPAKPASTPSSPNLGSSTGSIGSVGSPIISSSPNPAKWTPQAVAKTTPATSSVNQKPAYMTVKPTTATPAAAGAPVITYTGAMFSAAELRNMLKNPASAFEGFDKTQIEQYLEEGEFQQLLGMTKAAYNQLPKWKQAPLKSKAKLF